MTSHNPKTLREQLEGVILYEEWHGNELLGEPLGNYPDAIEAVLKAFESVLPEKRNLTEYFGKSLGTKGHEDIGFNEAIDQITKAIREER